MDGPKVLCLWNKTEEETNTVFSTYMWNFKSKTNEYFEKETLTYNEQAKMVIS